MLIFNKLETLEIEADKNWFSIIFKRPKKSYEERVYGTKSRFVEESGESSEKILALIRDNRYISARVLSEYIGISQRAVEKEISKLKRSGVLLRIGPAKGGYWEVIGDENNDI